jgi:glycerate 2-kinase
LAIPSLRDDLVTIVRAALAAIDAGRLVRDALGSAGISEALRTARAVDVIAAGKAAPAMLSAAAATGVPPRQMVGVAAHTEGQVPAGARWHTTAHPVPDERSVAAASDVLGVARAASERDLLLVLLSGGASSIVALPADGITLEDKQHTSRRLLDLGAEIRELNAVRKHLSRIKGGWLAAVHAGPTLTLALSDVVGDDLSSIGSGPTVPDPTTFGETLGILDRHGGRDAYPAPVVDRLRRGASGGFEETPKPGDARLARSIARVIGGGRTAVEGARAAGAALGYAVHVVDRPVIGEARHAAHELVDVAAQIARAETASPLCIIAAGETTVRTSGSGKGGRNQECVLAMARRLDTIGPAVAAVSIGTDGIDGPTDAAGAIVDSTTLARAEAADVGPPERYLDEHNSYVFFDELGDLIRTGPTGTNVGDLQVILVGSR